MVVLKYKRALISLSAIFLLINLVYGQDNSGSALKYNIGTGFSHAGESSGNGYIGGVGHEVNIWKDRLRFTNTVSFGYFDARDLLDAPDEFHVSLNYKPGLSCDVIRFKAISLTLGIGGDIERIHGLMGTGGFMEPIQNSYYIDSWAFGAYINAGLRICPKRSRIFFEFMPYNLSLLINDHACNSSYISLGIML
jgi:hypothetical protein